MSLKDVFNFKGKPHSNWTLVSTFTISNTVSFTNAKGQTYYGFHDVINLNSTYYAFSESNQGQTMIVSSTLGTDDWQAFASVGGTSPTDGPLQLPTSGTPTGSFFDLGNDKGYGKIHIPGDDAAIYLAINTAAKTSLSPADLEAAFINPANWTWNDGTTGLPTTPILTATSYHDYREAWLIPNTNSSNQWTIIYTAKYTGDVRALGYAGPSQAAAPPSSNGIYLPIIFKNSS